MDKFDAQIWLESLKDDIGRYSDLWHYGQAIDQIIALLNKMDEVEE